MSSHRLILLVTASRLPENDSEWPCDSSSWDSAVLPLASEGLLQTDSAEQTTPLRILLSCVPATEVGFQVDLHPPSMPFFIPLCIYFSVWCSSYP